MILDGWGFSSNPNGNAVFEAKTPHLDGLEAEYPHAHLVCSGKAVGLPEGIMGNSEVGHLNIGAGRIVCQELRRIDNFIQDGSFFKNDKLKAVNGVPVNDKTLALDVIKEVGIFKDFLGHEDTFNHMRFQSRAELIDRSVREDWEKAGSTDVYQRAKEKCSISWKHMSHHRFPTAF